MQYITGAAIRTLRERQHMTQRQLAEKLGVSDKAVSKWETDRGLPDVSLLLDLAEALGVGVAELLTGEYTVNGNRSANMKRVSFYVCPVCGNIIQAVGRGAYTCCGVTLPPLEVEDADSAHTLCVTDSYGDLYVTVNHPMTKNHYLSFLAYVTSDRVELLKLYPEGTAHGRFQRRGHGLLYGYCNQHGLYCIKI